MPSAIIEANKQGRMHEMDAADNKRWLAIDLCNVIQLVLESNAFNMDAQRDTWSKLTEIAEGTKIHPTFFHWPLVCVFVCLFVVNTKQVFPPTANAWCSVKKCNKT